jgi:hypothetical protein
VPTRGSRGPRCSRTSPPSGRLRAHDLRRPRDLLTARSSRGSGCQRWDRCG